MGPGTLHQLFGGTRLTGVQMMAAFGDYVAILAYSDDWGNGAGVVVFRRSDGLQRLLRPGTAVERLALNGSSLYLSDPVWSGAARSTILRYDLGRLDEMGEPPP
jgi:hypothetical protein